MTKKQFFEKMDYEGGLYELAHYGISPEEIKDKELSRLWAQFKEAFDKCERISDEIMNLL